LLQRLLATEGGDDVDLGAVAAAQLAEAVRAHAAEVEGAELFIALATHPQAGLAGPAAIELVKAADVVAMMEIATWLGQGNASPVPTRKALGRAFLDRAMDRSGDYGTRAQALKATMILAQSDEGLLLRLLGELVDLEPEDDGEFLRHAAAVAGAVLAHRPDNNALRGTLTTLVQVPEAEDEAAMELGLDCLRTGLDATVRNDAIMAFERARDWFAHAEATSEARIDARLYRRCLDMLVDFHAGRMADDLGSRIDAIRATAFAYTAFLTIPDRQPETASWLGAKDAESIHWSALAIRLGALHDKLTKGAWLKAAMVMEEELLAVYAASRSILRRAEDGGLDAVIRPRIVGTMQRELGALHVLEQWIRENAESAMLADAVSLRDQVRDAYEGLVSRRPSEAAAGSSPTAAIIEQLPEDARSTVSALIEADALTILDNTTSRIVDGVIGQVIDDLKRNVDYRDHSDARQFFGVLILYATRFVVSRYNLSVASFPGVAYLFNRDKANPPLEEELQHDFLNFLMGSPLAGSCTAEARDLGGGRVDILFTYTWVKTTAELKRSFPNQTPEQLVDRYGPQAISYQGTTVSFSMLMVLDLFDRKGAQPNIRDQISVHYRTVAESGVENAVVLFRVQGMRHTPSDVPKSALT
jgi:hypothetical protein